MSFAFCPSNKVTPLDSWDIAVAHLALFSRPAYATPDSFVPFCSTKSNCFVLAACERERMQDKEWLRGGLGTEIINARLPATPHYSVRTLFLSTSLHREFFVRSKTKGRHFLWKRNFIYAVNMARNVVDFLKNFCRFRLQFPFINLY